MLFYKWDTIKELSQQKSSVIGNYDKDSKSFFDMAVQATELFSSAERSIQAKAEDGCPTGTSVEEMAVAAPPQQQCENPKIVIVKRSSPPTKTGTRAL